LLAGRFVSGLRHGKGSLKLGEDVSHGYAGDWINDQKHGWGTMVFPSGSVFEGQWQHDSKCGFGTMYWTDRQERYRGFWDANVQSGVGEHVWYDGLKPELPSHATLLRCNRYVGMMKDGRRNGEGTMLYSGGAADKIYQELLAGGYDLIGMVFAFPDYIF
jgi:hypothetical protein